MWQLQAYISEHRQLPWLHGVGMHCQQHKGDVCEARVAGRPSQMDFRTSRCQEAGTAG